MEEQYHHFCSIRYQNNWLIRETFHRSSLISSFYKANRLRFLNNLHHFCFYCNKGFPFYVEKAVSRIMILLWTIPQYLFIRNKIFLCAAVKKNMLFWREILFHQSSHRYLTYSYLMIFHKVVTKACTNLSIFQFDPIHSFVELFILSQTRKNLHQYLNFNSNMGLIHTPCSEKYLPSEKGKNESLSKEMR
uniref:Ycf2 N-terminal domain-containing protein n=1 Tax=Salix viminalis TaxID=40686 RepID=A0A6N2KMR3_SALVM